VKHCAFNIALGFATIVAGGIPLLGQPSAPHSGKTYRNPLIERIGPADPHVIRHGRYYLYPTTDGKGFDVFVSHDLVHWEAKGKCFTDPRGGAWAPDVFHHAKGNGKFYLYYTLNEKPGSGGLRKIIGVAVADGPLGPFHDRGTLAERAIDAHLENWGSDDMKTWR
jgi:beta-xylosidase